MAALGPIVFDLDDDFTLTCGHCGAHVEAISFTTNAVPRPTEPGARTVAFDLQLDMDQITAKGCGHVYDMTTETWS